MCIQQKSQRLKLVATESESLTSTESCSSEFDRLNSVLEMSLSTSSITAQMRPIVRDMLRRRYKSPDVNQSLEILYWNIYTSYTEASETELAEMALQCLMKERSRRM